MRGCVAFGDDDGAYRSRCGSLHSPHPTKCPLLRNAKGFTKSQDVVSNANRINAGLRRICWRRRRVPKPMRFTALTTPGGDLAIASARYCEDAAEHSRRATQ